MRRFLKIIFLLFLFLRFGSPAFAQEQIRDFKSEIIINRDGTINVKETIQYDFVELERHGIFRNIPFTTKNKEGKKFRLDFSHFSVSDETGNKYNFQKSTVNEAISLKIGDANKTLTGVHTYIINYKVAGALTYFSDHDELYWNATGNEWTVPIMSASANVILPAAVDMGVYNNACYTGVFGSSVAKCNFKAEGTSVDFTSETVLSANEGLTIVSGFPKKLVAVLEAKPYVTFWETIFGKLVAGLIALAALFWYIVYPIWIPIKWLRQGRDPKPVDTGETRAWFDPPKSKTGRPLTPEETGALVDERADMQDISGMIISLAQKGYFKIEERKKGEFHFSKRKDFTVDKDLLPLEINLLKEIFASGDDYQIRKNKLYTAVEKAKEEIYEKLVSEGFFTENPNKVRTFYSVIGVLALTTGNIGLGFSAFFFGRNMPKKTPSGSETAAVARSLRNFLTSQERQLKFQADKQLMFEKLLPYAVVFGVEKIWAERFKDIQLKPPDWYSSYSTTRFNSVVLTNNLNSSFASVRSAATPVSSSTGHGSGFSGGSSGGGGGGGGGGSW